MQVKIKSINVANISFENMSQFKYFGTTITNQNLVQKEIKRRMNSPNACYHSIQKPLPSYILSKNIIIWTYKPIICLVLFIKWNTQ
jgi:hypothetical protein